VAQLPYKLSNMKVAVPKNCISNTDPTKDLSTKDLLNWISDVTIKRRQIRKSTRCSNLVAEAVLSSALREAKKELACKQEDRKRKLQRFCKRFSTPAESSDNDNCTFSNETSERVTDSNDLNDKCSDSDKSVDMNNSIVSMNVNCYQWTSDHQQNNYNSCAAASEMDSQYGADDVDSCLQSLDNFFNDLKSVKV